MKKSVIAIASAVALATSSLVAPAVTAAPTVSVAADGAVSTTPVNAGAGVEASFNTTSVLEELAKLLGVDVTIESVKAPEGWAADSITNENGVITVTPPADATAGTYNAVFTVTAGDITRDVTVPIAVKALLPVSTGDNGNFFYGNVDLGVEATEGVTESSRAFDADGNLVITFSNGETATVTPAQINANASSSGSSDQGSENDGSTVPGSGEAGSENDGSTVPGSGEAGSENDGSTVPGSGEAGSENGGSTVPGSGEAGSDLGGSDTDITVGGSDVNGSTDLSAAGSVGSSLLGSSALSSGSSILGSSGTACVPALLTVGLPLLAVLPFAAASQINLPILNQITGQINGEVQRFTREIAGQLGIQGDDTSSQIAQLNAQLGAAGQQAGQVIGGVAAAGALGLVALYLYNSCLGGGSSTGSADLSADATSAALSAGSAAADLSDNSGSQVSVEN